MDRYDEAELAIRRANPKISEEVMQIILTYIRDKPTGSLQWGLTEAQLARVQADRSGLEAGRAFTKGFKEETADDNRFTLDLKDLRELAGKLGMSWQDLKQMIKDIQDLRAYREGKRRPDDGPASVPAG